jgi:hypothetical protein
MATSSYTKINQKRFSKQEEEEEAAVVLATSSSPPTAAPKLATPSNCVTVITAA